MLLDFGAASDVGLRRDENQDRYLADGSVFAVADGLGGHSGGATAASIATEALSGHGRPESLEQLVALVGSANTAIFEAAIDDPSLAGMSTTLCALADIGTAGDPARLAATNVGDSRLYVLAGWTFQPAHYRPHHHREPGPRRGDHAGAGSHSTAIATR